MGGAARPDRRVLPTGRVTPRKARGRNGRPKHHGDRKRSPTGCSSHSERGNFGALTRQVIFRRRPEGIARVPSTLSSAALSPVAISLRTAAKVLLFALLTTAGFIALSG